MRVTFPGRPESTPPGNLYWALLLRKHSSSSDLGGTLLAPGLRSRTLIQALL